MSFPYLSPEGQQVYADPMRVERRLVSACAGDVRGVLKLAQSENAEQADKYTDLWVRAVAYAFGIQPFDQATGQGVGEGFLLDLYESFLDWKEKKNPTPGSTPSSPPTSPATSQPSAPMGAAAFPTTSASLCG